MIFKKHKSDSGSQHRQVGGGGGEFGPQIGRLKIGILQFYNMPFESENLEIEF